MIRKVVSLFFLICAVLCQAEQAVWQLGKLDGSGKEFKPNYHAWEYGNAPAIQNSPAMDHKTHTFHYAIKTNQVIPDPQIVSGLVTESAQQWMNADEIVSNLRLSWNEEEAGIRRLEFCVVDWSNPFAGKDGIEVTLPDGGLKSFNLPDTKRKWNGEKEPLKFTVTFAVKTGENRLDIKIVAMANHHKFQFDSITLFSTNTPPEPLPPALRVQFNKEDGIYHPGDEASLTLTGYNFPDGEGKIDYVIEDAFAAKIAEGRAELKNSRNIIHLPSCQRGYFKLKSTSKGLALNVPYVVIEPVKAEYIADSRFGCHALRGDGLRLRFLRELNETAMRRAFLAGARWVRYHSINWSSREPEKGKFDWTCFDEPLALAEKYKMNLLLVFGKTPAWASSSKDQEITIVGSYRFQESPPENWKDWADFLGTAVNRYKGKIKWYELWNEPGFRSAFWANGSAEDYAMLLKTGYNAVKKADPESVVLSGAPLTTGFMDEVIRCNGGKFYFDVMSVHYLQAGKSTEGIIKEWKNCMTQVGGGNVPMVNTEEMDWKSGGNLLEKASTLIKMHMREAALGIEKTFAFDLFHSGSMFDASAFDYQGKVLPVYAAYRTMTHHLEHANFVNNLSTCEIEAYLFDRQGTPVIVFWGPQKSEWELPFSVEQISEINMMDVENLRTTTADKLVVKVSSYPQFLVGGDLKTLREYAKILHSLYPAPMVMQGKSMIRNLNWNSQFEDLKLKLPANWKGTINRAQLNVAPPTNTPVGVYDAAISLSLGRKALHIPFLIEVSGSTPGENLIQNGDFKKSSAYWFYPKDNNRFEVIKSAGVDGGNAARTTKTVHFGYTDGIKVREGERYALLVEAKGKGKFGGIYSIQNVEGKELFPQKQGINCLMSQVGPDWRTFCQEITINQPKAAILKFSMLAQDVEGGSDIFFNRIAIVRLSDKYTLHKAVWRGICTRTSGMPADWNKIPSMTVNLDDRVTNSKNTKWNGADDLSASCQMALDADCLYLRFTVKDDVHNPVNSTEERWKGDSVQFAIDPTMEGRDRTEILIAEDKNGKASAYKDANFWTPELPENLTRHGLMPDTEVKVEKSPGKTVYTIRVPLRELYPLSAKTEEFGFSWLVNDNDGNERKYIQWSSGIGPSKTPALFGYISARGE